MEEEEEEDAAAQFPQLCSGAQDRSISPLCRPLSEQADSKTQSKTEMDIDSSAQPASNPGR